MSFMSVYLYHLISKCLLGLTLRTLKVDTDTDHEYKGGDCFLRRFQQLRSYRDKIETRNREDIPYSSRIVPRGLSAAIAP